MMIDRPSKGRGRSITSERLISAMVEIAESIQPCSSGHSPISSSTAS